MTSAQTRKPSRKMITAAPASSARTVHAFRFRNTIALAAGDRLRAAEAIGRPQRNVKLT
jgi:hypothetical protein